MLLKVKVFPDAPKNCVEEKEHKLYLFVRSPALHNQANIAARRLLAEHLGVSELKLRITNGHHSQNKTFELLS